MLIANFRRCCLIGIFCIIACGARSTAIAHELADGPANLAAHAHAPSDFQPSISGRLRIVEKQPIGDSGITGLLARTLVGEVAAPARPAGAAIPISDLPGHFDPRALVRPITEIQGILSDGSKATVYRIVIRSIPPDHEMGPWAPATIKDKGGYWEDTVDHKLYRVDVDYLKILNGRGWDMFDADGAVHRTKNRTEFDKIARQELAGWTFEQAKRDGVINSVIELKPLEQIVTIFLPKSPKAAAKQTMLRQAKFSPRSGVGIGVDGVRFFPPEPVNRITAFQNIAPLDPFGGHTGFGHEYHYHRAPAVLADDKSGKVVGYALDGFPILGPTEADGSAPEKLDQINGHDHGQLGYHYHAANQRPYFVGGFNGPLGTAALGEVEVCDATQQQAGGPPGGGGAGGGRGNGPPGGGPPGGGPPGGGPPGGGPPGRRPDGGSPPGAATPANGNQLNEAPTAKSPKTDTLPGIAPSDVPAIGAPAARTSSVAKTSHPNVLILLVDDMGWNGIGIHDKSAPTPNLNRLAKEGLELQRFYTYPVCSPARAALLSGMMPRRFGIVDVLGPRQAGLPAGIATLPSAFGAAGYQTSLIGKWHLSNGNPPMKCGFDHFYGFMGPEIDYYKHTNQRGAVNWQRDGTTLNEEGYSTYLLADEAIRQIKQRDAKKPFFIEIAFNAPHVPLAAPEDLVAKHKAAGIYPAVIEALDLAIGKVLGALDDQGLREDTIVLFYSDNGASRRESNNAPLAFGKGTVYEGGIRTPCIVRWPGNVPAGAVTQQPVSGQDFFPTLAAAAGVALPAGVKLDGMNQWPALSTGKVVERTPFLIAAYDIALIDGDWKLIEWTSGKHSLFNLRTDISETKDEITTQPEVSKRLLAMLVELKQGLPEAGERREVPGGRPGGTGGPGGPRGAGNIGPKSPAK